MPLSGSGCRSMFLLLWWAVFACTLHLAVGQRQSPNILFVVMDDLGFADLGRHGSGILTPVADDLAQNGLYLENYHVLPTCTLTRIALMTGRFPYRMGQYEVVRQGATNGMPLNEATLPQMLAGAGYQTRAVGKWHLGHSKYEQTPTFRGFQSFYGYYHAGALDYFNHSNTMNGLYDMRYDEREFCGAGCSRIVDERGNYSTFVYAREAERVINEHDENNGPLFLYLAFQAVHTPFQVPQEYVDLYQQSPFRENRKIYAGMLTAADEALGQVVDALKAKGLWENTLLVYTTDNGGPPGWASNAPLKGGKKDIWEGGVAGEGFLSGPALASLGIPSGTTADEIFHVVDWLPTLASIANVTPPSDKPLDGVDQLATLQGTEVARQEIFLGYSVSVENKNGRNGAEPAFTAFRLKRFKLIRLHNRSEFVLYNLHKDREEHFDLAGEQPIRVKVMKRKMEQMEAFFVGVNQGDQTCKPFRGVSWQNTTWNQPLFEPWCSGSGV